MSDAQDKLLDHDYDGIRELDNDLPRWWVWLFYLTIIWGVLYFTYYHVTGIGYTSAEQYLAEIDPTYERIDAGPVKAFGIIPRYRSPLVDPQRDRALKAAPAVVAVYKEESRSTDTTSYVAMTEAGDITEGKVIFDRLCFTCHGKLGEGGIGPNLTDDYWLHGSDFPNIVKTIKYGVPAKGMVAWRMDLKPEQILQVASYVKTLHGTNPPNPKAPQGELAQQ